MKPIWIVDDDASIRWVLEKALARENLATRSFASGREALAAFETDTPQVLVSDIRMPGESGLEGVPKLLHEHPDVKVLVLSMQDDPRYVREAFAAGASGYVLKEAADAEVVAAVREVARGGR